MQVFNRQYKHKRYTLTCESMIIHTCGCIPQPHVHFIRLTYRYGFSYKFPYSQSHYVDYLCHQIPEALQAIESFHHDGLAEIAMMESL